MRTNCLTCLAAVVSGFVGLGIAQSQNDDSTHHQPKARLPGARTVVDASKFSSLQAAIDALPADGGAVHLPPGTFEIDQPLRVTSEDVLIQGSGTATHVKNVATSGSPTLIIEPPANKQSLWRVRLADLRITGNPESGHGVVARKVDELFVDGVTISYHGGNGILLDHCYEDPRICNCLITYNKQTGLALHGCHDIVVAANQFEENRDALSCFDGFNLCMTGNCLDDHLRHGVVIENTYGSVLSGNMIEECRGTAVILDRDCYGITVSANVIAHNFGGGVDLRDAHGCAVSANTFTIVPQRAVAIGSLSSRVTVGANTFADSFIGEQEKRAEDDQGASGVVLQGTQEINISGNVLSGLDHAAIRSEKGPSRRLLIANNLLAETRLEDGYSHESMVTDNLSFPRKSSADAP